MQLKINKQENKITINFNKEFLELFINEEDQEKNTQWNTNGINDFLIKLSSNLPEDEKIELVYNENLDDKIYEHIVNLFKSFIDSYNITKKNNEYK